MWNVWNWIVHFYSSDKWKRIGKRQTKLSGPVERRFPLLWVRIRAKPSCLADYNYLYRRNTSKRRWKCFSVHCTAVINTKLHHWWSRYSNDAVHYLDGCVGQVESVAKQERIAEDWRHIWKLCTLLHTCFWSASKEQSKLITNNNNFKSCSYWINYLLCWQSNIDRPIRMSVLKCSHLSRHFISVRSFKF